VNTRYLRSISSETYVHIPSLVIIILLFSFGLTMGCAFASFLRPDADSLLFSYLNEYFTLLNSGKSGGSPSLPATFWEFFRWPLFATLIGTTLIGTFTAPALLLLRGFLLSYAISVFIRFWGTDGLLWAAVIFGLPALCSVVSLFIISLDILSFHRSINDSIAKTTVFSHLLFTAIILSVGSLIHHWLSPVLLRLLTVVYA